MVFDYSKLPREFPRKYVPRDMPFDWESLSPLFDELKGRPVNTREDLEKWMADEDELDAVVYERRALTMVNYSRQTDDDEFKRAYTDFVQELEPLIKLAAFELVKKYVAAPVRRELPPSQYMTTDRNRENVARIFREENVPLEKEEARLVQKYQGVMGAMSIQFKGEERTLQQMAKFLEETDRKLREESWRLSTSRLLEDAWKLDEIYDGMIKIRTSIGKNAGFQNYRDYAFRLRNRFDYTPEDCTRFHDAVEKYFVPLSREVDEERRRKMGLGKLAPWDLNVDPDGKQPLAPFGRADELVAGCAKIFSQVDPQFSRYFDMMTSLELRDLESRKGKAPGGFQDEFTELRLPFIFMNAAKRDGDVRVLLHESGHSFHSFLMREAGLPLFNSGQGLPAEFAEVASTSMELVGGEHLEGIFYGPEDTRRSNREEVIDMIKLFPWVATIDSFQHWVYTAPGHSADERAEAWSRIFRRFSGLESYEGYEQALRYRWQRQLHLYQYPFYYIEYGIATLGALGIWLRYREDPKGAVASYKRALSLGSSRTLPELFQAAELPWDLGPGSIESYARELRTIWKSYA
ncbi:MAG TPA: M3 family oligoendopeptidase [Nitrososphaerales archaeon]|nr:M3 family oligoendopeptidase [Nitrososphaerales archaeon]